MQPQLKLLALKPVVGLLGLWQFLLEELKSMRYVASVEIARSYTSIIGLLVLRQFLLEELESMRVEIVPSSTTSSRRTTRAER